ncbi:MAG: glycosyltransferase family 2 protein [Sphingobacteriaceae bacterium]|nr:glycosyltransferase family 2 protein [Cytophagaceae bacterium]
MTPRLSVCIPAYRQTRYLRRALDSLREQTFTDFEIVLTDDSPDDEVADFVENYQFGPRLRYFHNPRSLGTPENWNEAVRQSRGELIKILHHDDWLAQPDSLQTLVDALDAQPEADLVFCASVATVADTGVVRDVNRPTPAQVDRLRSHPEELFAANRIGAPSATLYRRRAGLTYDSILTYTVDTDFYIRLLRQNPALVYVNEPLVAIGLNEGQVTQSAIADRGLLLREYAYTYQKLGLNATRNLKIARFWWEFFHRHHVHLVADFRAAGYAGPVGWELRMLMGLAPLAGVLGGYLRWKARRRVNPK